MSRPNLCVAQLGYAEDRPYGHIGISAMAARGGIARVVEDELERNKAKDVIDCAGTKQNDERLFCYSDKRAMKKWNRQPYV